MENIKFYDLLEAFKTIFGNNKYFNIEKLNNLTLNEIKSAYRKKSKNTHPDISNLLGKDEITLNNEFKKLNNSYNIILNYKKRLNKIEHKKNNNFPEILPERKLRFGEFLYHKKKINWQTLMEAIISQKSFKNKIGNICLEFKFLHKNDINNIMKNKNIKEKFGQTAIRKGFLTSRQLKLILDIQNNRKNPIGKYFVDNNIINKNELITLLNLNKLHNQNIQQYQCV